MRKKTVVGCQWREGEWCWGKQHPRKWRRCWWVREHGRGPCSRRCQWEAGGRRGVIIPSSKIWPKQLQEEEEEFCRDWGRWYRDEEEDVWEFYGHCEVHFRERGSWGWALCVRKIDCDADEIGTAFFQTLIWLNDQIIAILSSFCEGSKKTLSDMI